MGLLFPFGGNKKQEQHTNSVCLSCLLTSAEENEEDDVGKQGGEVDHLAGALDAFHHAGVNDEPRQCKTAHQLPLHLAHVFPRLAGHTQHAIPKR